MLYRRLVLAVFYFLLFTPGLSIAQMASWGNLVYEIDVSPQTKDNFQKAFDTVDAVFMKYGIVLSHPITIVVAGNDAESYIKALMIYAHQSRAQAEDVMNRSVMGKSLQGKDIVIIRYLPTRQLTAQGTSYLVKNNPEEGFFILPHEVWHQAAYQYGSVHSVNWINEGSAELFKFMVLEAAGIRKVSDSAHRTEQSIGRAAEIPATRQLASSDYKEWMSLTRVGTPIYDMAALMMVRLVGDNGFEKVIFYYQLLHDGKDPEKAFFTAFGVQSSDFLSEMDDYFRQLRR